MSWTDRADGEAGLPMQPGGNFHDHQMGIAALKASKAAEQAEAARKQQDSLDFLRRLSKMGTAQDTVPKTQTTTDSRVDGSDDSSWLIWLMLCISVLAFAWLAPIVGGWLEQRRISEARLAVYNQLSDVRESPAALVAFGPRQPWYDPFGWGSTRPNAHGQLFDSLDEDELSGADAALLCQMEAAIASANGMSWDADLAKQSLDRRYDALGASFLTRAAQCIASSGVTVADMAASRWPDNAVGVRERRLILSRLAHKLPEI